MKPRFLYPLLALLAALGVALATDFPLPTASTYYPQTEDNDQVLARRQAAAIASQGVGATGGATLVSSSAYEASHVLKASAGTLIAVIGYNSKASAQFIQLYNTSAVPADTAVPVLTFTVPATSNFSVDVPVSGLPFTTGICVANSSTGPTKTLGSADCFFTAVVK